VRNVDTWQNHMRLGGHCLIENRGFGWLAFKEAIELLGPPSGARNIAIGYVVEDKQATIEKEIATKMTDTTDIDAELRAAFELVLELAAQNMIDDNDDDLAGEALRQQDAIDKVGTLLDTMVIQRKRIAELEASVENWRGIAMNADGDGSLAHERALKAERERDELQALIDKQHERTASADAAWQAATGRHDTLPDLGALIEWLQDRAEQAEQKRDAALSLIRAAYERLGLHQIDHTTVHSLATDDLIRQLIAAGGAR